MIEFHNGHGGEASIMVTKVEESSKYSEIVMEESRRMVDKFIEKLPKLFYTGIYLLNPFVFNRFVLRPISMEEEVFPHMAAEKKLFAMVFTRLAMDIGQPRNYISGMRLYWTS